MHPADDHRRLQFGRGRQDDGSHNSMIGQIASVPHAVARLISRLFGSRIYPLAHQRMHVVRQQFALRWRGSYRPLSSDACAERDKWAKVFVAMKQSACTAIQSMLWPARYSATNISVIDADIRLLTIERGNPGRGLAFCSEADLRKRQQHRVWADLEKGPASPARQARASRRRTAPLPEGVGANRICRARRTSPRR